MRPYRVANVDPYVLKPEVERALKPLQSFRECAKVCPEMVVLPAGEFMMGSPATESGHAPREGPQHKVTIARPFAVSKFDVTIADWDACASVHGFIAAPDRNFAQDTQPVTDINWNDAQEYVAWLSKMTGQRYRLLTEAEWEFAYRAGTTSAYYWGNEIGKGNASANVTGDRSGTFPVGSFKPNAFGLYDMAGNVWQWVQDCYHGDYNGAPTDGSEWTGGDCTKRVTRGGTTNQGAQSMRAATRGGDGVQIRYFNLGFRVARTLTH
jgi:formylglycine-generating enzyme required for sulfatase activity